MPTPKDSIAFADAMADVLRLPDDTLAMSYLYTNRYRRFLRSSPTPDPLDQYTLALASLSLASKSTESPRRLREFILPAHRLLHPLPSSESRESSHSFDSFSNPLTVPSAKYDTLRATLVQAELILLRVLGFDLRISIPLSYLPRYLERAMQDVAEASEDYETWGKEEREEYGMVGQMDTGIGRACKAKTVQALVSETAAVSDFSR
ncbi:hypothetical protein MMC12_002515 [Toensbergia leucococca]|nr:hypothetical protein [Toensbergia leucococca]